MLFAGRREGTKIPAPKIHYSSLLGHLFWNNYKTMDASTKNQKQHQK